VCAVRTEDRSQRPIGHGIFLLEKLVDDNIPASVEEESNVFAGDKIGAHSSRVNDLEELKQY
jgi:hypothetical protein